MLTNVAFAFAGVALLPACACLNATLGVRTAVALDQEIELWELRITAVRDRHELSRRLRWVQSDLADIDLSKVIEIQSVSPAGAPVASIY
jgi:hypothetical protein